MCTPVTSEQIPILIFLARLHHSVEVLEHFLIFRQNKKNERKYCIIEYKTKLCDSFCMLQKPHQNNATLKENISKTVT